MAMKTIEERAKDYSYSHGNLYMDSAEEEEIYRGDLVEAFIAGAKSERNELTRWRDPKVELPGTDVYVLVMVHADDHTYDVMKYDQHGWWQKTTGGGWSAAEQMPTGWRYIREI